MTWLKILQQSDLKTPYCKYSMIAGSDNFRLVNCQGEYQDSVLITFACHRGLSIRAHFIQAVMVMPSNHGTGDIIVNP